MYKEDNSNIIEEFVQALDFKGTETFDEILGYVLAKTRRVVSAEAGTIFVPEPLLGNANRLRCVAVQNDRINIEAGTFTVPIDPHSIAGYTASRAEFLSIDDLYRIDPDRPYQFNASFDKRYDYKSVSMLSVPLLNIHNKVTGVIQLLNHITDVDSEGNATYGPFTATGIDSMKKLSLIIGMLVERMALLEEIERLGGNRREIGALA